MIDPLTASTLILGGISAVQGAVRGGKAKKLRGQYDDQMSSIPEQDPGQVAFLGDTRRRRRMFDTGTDPLTAYNQQQIMNTGAQTQANAVRAGRGNLSDLLRVQAGTDRGIAASGASAFQNSASLFGMEGNLVGAMADRLYNRELADANRTWSEYAELKEQSGREMQAAIGMGMQAVGGGFGKAKGVGGVNDKAGGGKGYITNSGKSHIFDPLGSSTPATRGGGGTYGPGNSAPDWWVGQPPSWYTPQQ